VYPEFYANLYFIPTYVLDLNTILAEENGVSEIWDGQTNYHKGSRVAEFTDPVVSNLQGHQKEADRDVVGLKRVIGLGGGISIIVGIMIGNK